MVVGNVLYAVYVLEEDSEVDRDEAVGRILGSGYPS